MTFLQQIKLRTTQTLLALRVRNPSEIDVNWFPNRPTCRLFCSLPVHDQRHLVAVHAEAVARGLDSETCVAALLHDIGKVSLSGRGIRVYERILHVMPLAPRPDRQAVASGIELANYHAQIGADRLRALGVGERICWLVEHHDDPASHDPQLHALQEIDNATP